MPDRIPLQLLPSGLLGFFDLKNGGQYPQYDGLPVLQPTIDLREWYFETNAQYSIVSALSNLVLGFTALTTTGDRAYFNRLSIQTDVIGAAETVTCAVAIRQNLLAAVPVVYVLSDFQSAIAGDQVLLTSNKGFFLPPGSELGVWSKQLTGVIQARAMFDFVVLPD